MSTEWLKLKSFMDSSNVSVFHIDEEGSVIPIDTECELQEAVRLSKLKDNRLKVFFSVKSNVNTTSNENQNECSNIETVNNSLKTANAETMFHNSSKESRCNFNGNEPPEWFTHYMEKFKRELLLELKSNISEIIHSTLKKEKKHYFRGDTVDLPFQQTEPAFLSAVGHHKKKRKEYEKDLGNLDQRDVKWAKKVEELHPIGFGRLEKLDNKTRMLQEERRRLIERKFLKLRKTNARRISKKEVNRKSVVFRDNELCLFLPKDSKFSVNLNFTNNGAARWEAPCLECYDMNGLYPEKEIIPLPKLQPMESGNVVLNGSVSQTKGLHYFRCKLFDGLEKFGPELRCCARIDFEDSKTNSKNVAEKTDDSVGVLIDFDKDEFTATRNKIEENINEIQNRLQDIDLLQPSASDDDGDLKGINRNVKNSVEFRYDCNDKSKHLEENGRKNREEKPEERNICFGMDCLHLINAGCSNETNKQKDENSRKKKKFDKKENLKRNSDSELSFNFLSEEEDENNFIIISQTSNGPSSAESAQEEKKFLQSQCEKNGEMGEKLKNYEKNRDEVFHISDNHQKNCVFFVEKSPDESEKKKKSTSTSYRFTAENLIESKFCPTNDRSKGRFTKFPFSGEEEEEEEGEGDGDGEERKTDCNSNGEISRNKKPHSENVFAEHTNRYGEKETSENLTGNREKKGERRFGNWDNYDWLSKTVYFQLNGRTYAAKGTM